jgi:hypothetical protein
MKNKFLLIFCSAALLTVMNTSYAASLPTSRGRSQMGGKVAGGGKLCDGKVGGIYANYIGRYTTYYSRDGLPYLRIYASGGDDGIAKVIFVNGRSIVDPDSYSSRSGEITLQKYQFKGSDREYRIKSGDRVRVIFAISNKKDPIECTIPAQAVDSRL